MGYAPRAILAGGLGFAVACLAACGGGSGLLSAGQSSSLNNRLDQVTAAVHSGDCGGAQSASAALNSEVDGLPATINPTLRQNLSQGAATVGQLAQQDCRQQHAVTTTSTPITTSTTSTTTPTASTTTSSSTTTTTTTSTTTPTTTTTATTPTNTGTTSATTGGAGLQNTTTNTTTTSTGNDNTGGNGSGGAGAGSGGAGAGKGAGNGNGNDNGNLGG
jgi:hypothetical protein